MSRTRRWTWLLWLSWLGGCAGASAFGSTFPDNRAEDVRAVLARLKHAAPSDESRAGAVVVGVSDRPGQVFAYDLAAKRPLWKEPTRAVGAPHIAGDVVLVPERGQVRVRALADGALLNTLALDEGVHVVGADGEGALAAAVLSTGGSLGARSQLLLLRGGRLVHSARVRHALGGPAVLGGLVFVPWDNINLSVLDATGVELARVRVTDEVVSRAVTSRGRVYFGQRGIFRFDAKAARGTKAQASFYTPPLARRLPGNPSLLLPADKPPPGLGSALHSIRLLWRPARGDGPEPPLSFDGDRLYLLFYRLLFALTPDATSGHWVVRHDRDVVAASAIPAGVLLVDGAGRLRLIDGAGRTTWTADMGTPVAAAAVRADGFAPAAGGSRPPEGRFADQLLAAAQDTDARLVPARVLAVELLAGQQGTRATAHLITLCQEREAPDKLRGAACAALAARRSGAEAIAAALDGHADFLRGRPPPPVGPLARAAMGMNDRSVVPRLLAHLEDPATQDADLPALMLALKALGDEDAVPTVLDFLRTYHAEPAPAGLREALIIGIELVTALRGSAALDALTALADDPLGDPEVRSAASRAVAALTQAAAGAPPSAANGEGTPPPGQPATYVSGDGAQPPERLNRAHLTRALGPVMSELRECVRRDPSHPSSARLTLVLDGQGDVLLVRTLPESLQACVEPLVLSVPFPANRYHRRQRLTYQLTR